MWKPTIFGILKYPSPCSENMAWSSMLQNVLFGVNLGKFLGYLVIHRGIEVNPDQVQVVQGIQKPKTIKDIQKLTGMLVTLNRFISKSLDMCNPFFTMFKGGDKGILGWRMRSCIRGNQGVLKVSSDPVSSDDGWGPTPLPVYLRVGCQWGPVKRVQRGAETGLLCKQDHAWCWD